ncbi:hypothetical protein SDC9_135690 [bioreactor metagenome]|uniref:General secretion pathway GspH domain-containing protein n=1 Tax=bioreactor metagenome TaxID=1076179 RepID=A0A645DGX7_9ZZZZ
MRTHFSLSNRSRRRHYTIVEMMMVVAVFMIILAMITAAWLNSGPQVKLKSAARMVNAQLNLARAKAVAERKPVGVHFASSGEDYYRYGCRLFYDDNKNGTKAATENFVPDEEWVTLPGGVVFAVRTSGSDPQCVFSNAAPQDIAFDAKGRVVSGSATVPFYVTAGDRKTGPIQTGAYRGEPYFKFEVNSFTGRSTATYYEVND